MALPQLNGSINTTYNFSIAVQTLPNFISPATYGERIRVYTSIQEWRSKVFIQKHIVKRGDTVLCEGTETRAFCIRHPDDPDRIKAIPVPENIKAMCS